MNADRLLADYDRIADASDAVPRLRHFILDLAVRGKLVEQDPNDEPASELLKRIGRERSRREKEKSIKRPKLAYGSIALGTDFKLPRTWALTTLGEICDKSPNGCNTGSEPS